MANDFEAVSLGITASAQGATRAINNVIDGLSKLSISLKAFGSNAEDINNTTSAFEKLAASIDKIDTKKLDTMSRSMRAMSYAITSLAKTSNLLDLSPITQQNRSIEQSTKSAAATIAEQYGVRSKAGIKAVGEEFSRLVELTKQGDVGWEKLVGQQEWRGLTDVIKENMRVLTGYEGEAKKVLDYIASVNSSGRKVTLPFSTKEFQDDFKHMRATLGKAFTTEEGGTDIQIFVQEMNDAIGTTIPIANSAADTFANLYYSVVQLRDAAQGMNFKEALGQGAIDSNFEENMAVSILNTIDALAKERNALESVRLEAETVPETNMVEKIADSLKSFEGINLPDTKNVSDLASNVAKLGYANVNKAVENMPKISKALNEMLKDLQKAPQVSQNTIQITKALADLGNSGYRIGPATRTMSSGLNGMSHSMRNARKHTLNLAAAIGKFYASFWVAIRAVKGLWNAIGDAMGTAEVYNYFNKAYTDIAQKSVDNFGSMGDDAAKQFVENFEKEARDLVGKMTGFNIGENGEYTSTGGMSLGLNPQDVMRAETTYAQISSSMGVTSENANQLSLALTKIGADLASVKDKNYNEVWENMQSSLVGMSRAADQYGINIRQAAMQEKLEALGINAKVTALGQEEKALLRTIIILDESRYAWGDVSETMNQNANMVRQLKAAWDNLTRTIGSMFLGAIQTILPYVNAVVLALQHLAEWIIRIFGIEMPASSVNTVSAIGDISDSIYDTEDALDGASGSAKKLKQNLLGIDELNVISTDSGTGKSAGGVGGAASDELQKAFDDILAEYNSVWEQAYANTENKSRELADRIINAFAQEDWTPIGEFISGNLYDSLDNIDWDSVYDTAKNAGRHLAEVLNGFNDPKTFEKIGETLANSLNTAFYNVGAFIDTFDFEKAGVSAAALVNGFVDSIDEKQLAHDISEGIKGALKLISSFLSRTDFKSVGETIGNFLKELDWLGILKGLGVVIFDAIAGVLNGFSGIFDVNPMAGIIITGIAGAFTATKVMEVGYAFAKAIGSSKVLAVFGGAGTTAGEAVATGFTTAKVTTAIGNGATFLASHFFTVFTGAILGYKLGDWIAEQIYGEDWTVSNNIDTLSDFFSEGGTDSYGRTATEQRNADRQKEIESAGAWRDILVDTYDDVLGAENNYMAMMDDKSDKMIQFQEELSNTLELLGTRYADLDFSDWEQVSDYIYKIEDDTGRLTDDTWFYLQALSEQYNQLDANTRMFLEYQYGIDATADGVVVLQGELDTLRNRDMQYLDIVNEHREAEDRRTRAIQATIDATKQYAQEKKKEQDTTTSNYETTQRAIEATKDAVAQYRQEQENALATAQNTVVEYGALIEKLDSMSMSADDLSAYFDTLSSVDLPAMTTNLDNFLTTATTQFPLVKEEVMNGIDEVKNSLIGVKDWFTTTFEPMFTAEYWNKLVSPIAPAFQTAFTNACTGVVEIVNNMIDAINNAMNISWDAITINGDKVVEAGHAQIIDIPKIKGFANGGFPQMGSLFLANEAGPELVGTMNGKSAVASNGEITGIKEAIYDVASSIINEMRNDTTNVNVTLEGDAKGLFKSVRQEATLFQRSTGQNAFA